MGYNYEYAVPFAAYSGIVTFNNFPHTREITGADIVVMGVPFDSGTTLRTGAKFGPRAIRENSKISCLYNYQWNMSWNDFNFKGIDYGDVGTYIGPKSTKYMIEQTYEHVNKILEENCKVLILGGDHTIPYGPIRAAYKKYGKISLIHFDSHQDSEPSNQEETHANFAYDLVQEGCIDPKKSIQVCIRSHMTKCGYNIMYANEVMELSEKEIAKKIKDIVGDNPVYLTFDIDALDPAYAPGTGTPVCGGPSTHKMKTVLKELYGINVVAADVVEVSPPYDSSNITALAASSIAQDIMFLMLKDKIKR